MEIPQHRNVYSEEFKRQATDYFVEHRGTLAETAKNFGVTAGMLHKWLESRLPVPENSGSISSDTEIQKLRREVVAMKEDIGELRRIVSKAFPTQITKE